MGSVFNYDYSTNCCPIPPHERDLPTVTAEPFLQVVNGEFLHTEGVCFDRTGENMYFVGIAVGRVYRYNFERKELSVFWEDASFRAMGCKMHKDGRMFVACWGNTVEPGLVVLSPEGKFLEHIYQLISEKRNPVALYYKVFSVFCPMVFQHIFKWIVCSVHFSHPPILLSLLTPRKIYS